MVALRNAMGKLMELRDPVLRYVSSFGLPIQDGEEIAQEVFLACPSQRPSIKIEG